MNGIKHIIIPVGFNAAQSKASIMKKMPSSYAYEWMESADFVKEYLYCAKDGPYDPPVEVWLLVWDSPSNMVRKPHPNPKMKGCSNTELQLGAIGVNLVWCKAHHANIRTHLIYIMPPRINSKLYDLPDKHFLGVDDIHVIDMQEEISKVDGNMPLLDFLGCMDRRVAKIIAGPKPGSDRKDTLVMYKIPDSVTHMEDRAFASCKKLREVMIPETVESIGVNPFLRCCNLHVVSHSPRFVVESNMLIDRQTGRLISFFGDETDVEVPASVKEIGDWAFGGCAHLQKATLPATLSHIGDSAFKGCRKLQDIQFPDTLLNIGEWAFYQCELLEEIHIPESVTRIGDWAFCGCKKLQTIHLPGMVTLGAHVFSSCEGMEG